LPRSKAAKQQFILDLWDRQLEQDPRKVREMLELSSGEPDEWTIDLDQAERENRRLMQGDTSVQVEEWHNHPAHLYQHHLEMKSADWDVQSEELKQIWRDHCEDHERTMAVQQQQLQGGMPPDLSGGQTQAQASAQNGAQAAANPANGQPAVGAQAQFMPAESARDLLDEQPQ
jgi:hypothetical protein